MNLKNKIIDLLIKKEYIKYGKFILSSGKESEIYFDIKSIISDPSLLAMISVLFSKKMKKIEYDVICPILVGGLPIATAISIFSKKPMIYCRDKVKDYGTQNLIEGKVSFSDKIIIIDDVLTTGKSIRKVLNTLKFKDLNVKDAMVLVDRSEKDPNMDCNIHSVFSSEEILKHMEENYERHTILP